MAKSKVKNGVEEVSEKEFYEKINDKIALVDFFAEWCMPCVMMAPVIEDMSEKFKGKISFAKVNVDENQGLAEKYRIMSIPTLVIFKDGKEIDRIIGAIQQEQLVEKLKKLI